MALNEPFQEVRSHIGSLTYQIETSTSESTKDSLRRQIAELKQEVKYVRLPGDSEKRAYKYDQMDKDLQDWKNEKAALLEKRVALMKPATDLRAARDKYLSDRVADASTDTLAGLQRGLDTFDIRIRQIHIKDVDLVDRCESCHLGTREPVTLTAASMGGEAVFASHPGDKELLKIHDPERFGCTPCHGGNGAAVSSVEKAHGYNEHWLWPLHHRGKRRRPAASSATPRRSSPKWRTRSNQGREIFRLRGCMGCHRYEAFDRDADEMTAVNQEIRTLEQQKAEWKREVGFSEQKANNPRTSDAEARRLFQHANDLRVRSSLLDAQIEQLDMRSRRTGARSEEGGAEPEGSAHEAAQGMDPGVAEGSARLARGGQNADLPPGRRRDPRHCRLHLAIRRAGRSCRSRSRATRSAAKRPSKRAAAWPATPWAKAARSRAEPSPPTSPARGKRPITITWCAGCTIRASARCPTARSKRRTSRRRITSATACPSFSIWTTTSAPTTATSCRCSR